MSKSILLSDNSVADTVHAAFAAVTGTALVGSTVPGLHVQSDLGVDSAELDLFDTSGFFLTVNPAWALGLDPANLRDRIEAMVARELV